MNCSGALLWDEQESALVACCILPLPGLVLHGALAQSSGIPDRF
jgi:hypothetical protein